MTGLRVAVIGAGQFGIEHLRAYAAMPDVHLVGVSDANPDRAEAVARRFGTVSVPSAAIAADAVSIVVPAHARGSLTADVLASGAAAIIEKPLAESGNAAEAFVKSAGAGVVMVGHVLRFAEPYRRLAARSKSLGVLLGGSLARRRSADHAEMHPVDDVIGLTMIHDLDAVTWLSGSVPVSVAASGGRGADGRWVRCRAEVTTASGSRWWVDAEWAGEAGEHEDRASIEGAGGEASVAVSSAEAEAVYGTALARELRHFVDHARSGTPSDVLRMTDAALAVRLADAVRTSLDQEGAEIAIND